MYFVTLHSQNCYIKIYKYFFSGLVPKLLPLTCSPSPDVTNRYAFDFTPPGGNTTVIPQLQLVINDTFKVTKKFLGIYKIFK